VLPRRGLGGALGGERVGAAQARDHRDDESGDRVPERGEHRGEHRADDEDDLVEDRLQRVRRLHLARAVEQVRPPGAHARADLGLEGAGERRQDVGEQHRPVAGDRHDEQRHRHREAGDGQRQDPPLAESVHQTAVQHGARRLPEHHDPGDDAGDSVGPGLALHQQHHAQRHHRHGQPGHEPGRAEAEGAGPGQHTAVGVEHREDARPH
jgi:hypothetical protein